MEKKLKKAVEYLKRASVGSYTLAAILSILAELIVKFAIPGGGIIELILAIMAAVSVFAVVILQEHAKREGGIIAALHESF